MDIILHLGAHRSATTSFQHYVRAQTAALDAQSTAYWGPGRTRGGLLSGVLPQARPGFSRRGDQRAEGRLALNLRRVKAKGYARLLVSDENMIGSAYQSIRTRQLYPAIGERMARYRQAFGGRISSIVFSVRSPELWWASAAAYSVARGHAVPTPAAFEMIAGSPRSWREVITDLACAMPGTEIIVTPFEQYAGRPDDFLADTLALRTPPEKTPLWLNRAPDAAALRKIVAERGGDIDAIPDVPGRWQPFDAAQIATLRENYADDMHWLVAGAEGLATLAEDKSRTKTGQSLQAGIMTEGSKRHDSGQEELARSG